ncbi:hypothetical protein COOONC_19840, partial [Cooperia oncophora]
MPLSLRAANLVPFQDVVNCEEFNQLSADQLIELISNEELNVHSEERLLEHVRLPLCQPKFLVNTVSKDALVMADIACRDLLDEAKVGCSTCFESLQNNPEYFFPLQNFQLLQLSAHVKPEMQGTRTTPRKSFRFGEVLYVGT